MKNQDLLDKLAQETRVDSVEIRCPQMKKSECENNALETESDCWHITVWFRQPSPSQDHSFRPLYYMGANGDNVEEAVFNLLDKISRDDDWADFAPEEMIDE